MKKGQRLFYVLGIYFFCQLVTPFIPRFLGFVYDSLQNIFVILDLTRIHYAKRTILLFDPNAEFEEEKPPTPDELSALRGMWNEDENEGEDDENG